MERSEESNTPQNSQSSRNTWIAIIIVLAGVGIAFYFLTNGTLRFGSETVAVVNGENITRAELDERMKGINAQGGLAAEDTDNEEVKSEVLNSLIIEELLVQKAEEEGVALSKEDAKAQLEEMKEMIGEEEYQSSLEETGLSESEMIDLFQRMLSIQAYLEQQVPIDEITVSEENVREFFDSMYEGEEVEEGTFEEVQDNIAQQLKLEQQDKLIQEYIEGLQEESEIDIRL